MRLNKVPRGRASAALLPLQASRHAHALTHRRRVVAVQSVQSSSSGVGRSEKELPGDGMRFADSSMIAKLQVKAASVLTAIDEVGSWNIASCLVVLNVFVWETYSMDYLSAAMSMGAGFEMMEMDVTLEDLRLIENTINIIFSAEYGVRFFASGFSKKWFLQPQSLVDLAAVTPGILQAFGVGGELLQGSRILRILRLLRLISGDTNNRFFLLKNAGEVTVKLYEILVEFFVIFFTTSAIIFNIEHAVNPEFGDLGDSLYWAFLTLTGNEQPFDVVTGNGRLAAVLSYTIAIAVVPGQLARLLATLGDEQMREMEEMARGREGRDGEGKKPQPLPMLNIRGSSRNVLARLLPLGGGGFFRTLGTSRTPPNRGSAATTAVAAPVGTQIP